MGIDVNYANGQAARLRAQIAELNAVRDLLNRYKAEVSRHWQSAETGYILRADDRSLQKTDKLIAGLGALSDGIVSAAAAVRREEEAARQLAEQERRKREQYRQAEAARAKEARSTLERLRSEYEKASAEFSDIKRLYAGSAVFRPLLKRQYEAAREKLRTAAEQLKKAEEEYA